MSEKKYILKGERWSEAEAPGDVEVVEVDPVEAFVNGPEVNWKVAYFELKEETERLITEIKRLQIELHGEDDCS